MSTRKSRTTTKNPAPPRLTFSLLAPSRMALDVWAGDDLGRCRMVSGITDSVRILGKWAINRSFGPRLTITQAVKVIVAATAHRKRSTAKTTAYRHARAMVAAGLLVLEADGRHRMTFATTALEEEADGRLAPRGAGELLATDAAWADRREAVQAAKRAGGRARVAKHRAKRRQAASACNARVVASRSKVAAKRDTISNTCNGVTLPYKTPRREPLPPIYALPQGVDLSTSTAPRACGRLRAQEQNPAPTPPPSPPEALGSPGSSARESDADFAARLARLALNPPAAWGQDNGGGGVPSRAAPRPSPPKAPAAAAHRVAAIPRAVAPITEAQARALVEQLAEPEHGLVGMWVNPRVLADLGADYATVASAASITLERVKGLPGGEVGRPRARVRNPAGFLVGTVRRLARHRVRFPGQSSSL